MCTCKKEKYDLNGKENKTEMTFSGPDLVPKMASTFVLLYELLKLAQKSDVNGTKYNHGATRSDVPDLQTKETLFSAVGINLYSFLIFIKHYYVQTNKKGPLRPGLGV